MSRRKAATDQILGRQEPSIPPSQPRTRIKVAIWLKTILLVRAGIELSLRVSRRANDATGSASCPGIADSRRPSPRRPLGCEAMAASEVTLVGRTKMPCLSRHEKYRTWGVSKSANLRECAG